LPPAHLVHVVDDDASVRRSIARLLRANGFDVALYGSADEFMASGAAPSGGCILLDHEMPGRSGLELHQVLAAAPAHWEAVFLSGHGEIRKMLERVIGGPVEFLAKPAIPADLIAALQRAIARVQAHRAKAMPEAGSSPAARTLRRK
jgi:FixJ family two-component response regulator